MKVLWLFGGMSDGLPEKVFLVEGLGGLGFRGLGLWRLGVWWFRA